MNRILAAFAALLALVQLPAALAASARAVVVSNGSIRPLPAGDTLGLAHRGSGATS